MTQSKSQPILYYQGLCADILSRPLDYLLVHDEIVPNPSHFARIREELAQIASQFKGDALLLSANPKPQAWDDNAVWEGFR